MPTLSSQTLIAVIFACLLAGAPVQAQAPAADLAWALSSEPRTFDPAKVDDGASERIRFLTGGVLLRTNRTTQQPEPALAERYQISPDGRLITFHLRKGLRFSDGSSLTSTDAAASLRRVLDPKTAAPVAEEFLDAKAVTIDTPDPLTIRVHLPQRLVSVTESFDEIAIEPAAHPGDSTITAGPFRVGSKKPGEYILLERNPNYWKHDASGHLLPYLNTLRLDIVTNREIERVRYAQNQYQLMESIAPADFDDMRRVAHGLRDFGPSLNTEQMWFNQAPGAPLPLYERAWFTSTAFRQAVSLAIRRGDLARIAYKGHATPAYGFISPANRPWYSPHPSNPSADVPRALTLLQSAGFHMAGKQLVDASGNPVRFSLLTNAGNTARERMATLIAQDLAALGIQVNVVKLDFPALIERLMHSQSYEATLLGLTDVNPDPNSMMNVWLSNSPNHQWNPSEKSPATPWEAEIDQLMRQQSSSADFRERRRCITRLQTIVDEQQPFIYLVHPNLLYAVADSIEGLQLTSLQPGVVSNIDSMRTRKVVPR